MILSAIAAMARNRVIGKNNKLPWHIPEDLKYFKEKTKGKILIMGRKTYESLGGTPLPKRLHIVITRQKNYHVDHPMVKVVASLEEAIKLAKQFIPEYSDEVFVAGGGEIYLQSLPHLDRLYLTVIDQDYEGDAYFPDISSFNFKLDTKDERSGFSFCIYKK